MKDRELMRMALQAIDEFCEHQAMLRPKEIQKALRERLSQPEPEPVAWHEPGAYGNVTTHKDWALANGWEPLYTKENTQDALAERKRIVDLLMIQHEAANGRHNYWKVAAELIQADVASDT